METVGGMLLLGGLGLMGYDVRCIVHRAHILYKVERSIVGASEGVCAMVRKLTTKEDWIEFTAGRVQGSVAVFLALIETHPDPRAMLNFLERAEQAGLANVEPTPLSDRYIEGMRDMIGRARDHLHLRLRSE
jgi:hypothetical protein